MPYVMNVDFVGFSGLPTIIAIMTFKIIVAVLTSYIHFESFTVFS
jgi:hypothetical protein